MSGGAKGPIFSLGTANLGLDYGIASSGHESRRNNAANILNYACEAGITYLDTASAYGDAEQVIGKFWPENTLIMVTTKLSPHDCADPKSILASVDQSLANTNLESFWSVLLHDSSVLFKKGGAEIKDALLELLSSGRARRIGISAYTEAEVVRAKRFMPEMTVFQLPENICDRRKYFSLALTDLAQQGNLIFVRSIFLQGLLLMNPNDIPEKVATARQVLRTLGDLCQNESISRLELCMGYAKSIPWASGIVIGADSSKQLEEVYKAFLTSRTRDFSSLPTLDDWLIDPRNWS